METKYNYARVGAFVLILSFTMISIIIWLTVGTESKSYTRYQITTEESVSGLSLNSPVAYRGVDVGKVIDLKLDLEDPRFVQIFVDIEENTPIKEDTNAVLVSRGITGLMNVELKGGSPTSKILSPTKDQKYAVITNGPSLGKRLDDAFTQILSQVSNLSDNTSNFLSKENAQAVTNILKNAEILTSKLAISTTELTAAMNNISALARDISPQLRSILSSADKALSGDKGALMSINTTIKQISKTFKDYDTLALDFTKTSQSWNKFANRTDNKIGEALPRLNSLLVEAHDLINSFKNLVKDTDKKPNIFIFGKPSPRKGPGE